MEADEVIARKFRRLVELRETRDEAKKAQQEAEREYREYEGELYAELADSPVKGTRKIDLGPPYGVVQFTPRETYFGRILDAADVVEWLRETEQLDEFTKPKIAERKLNELVRERIEQASGQMPPGVDFTARRGITITRR